MTPCILSIKSATTAEIKRPQLPYLRRDQEFKFQLGDYE